jgi:hypothetical protein
VEGGNVLRFWRWFQMRVADFFLCLRFMTSDPEIVDHRRVSQLLSLEWVSVFSIVSSLNHALVSGEDVFTLDDDSDEE